MSPDDARERAFAGGLVVDGEALDRYRAELDEIDLFERIREAQDSFARTVSGTNDRGCSYGFAGIRPGLGLRLYALVRELRPAVLVETGVCNGVSTAMILAALDRNRTGELHSIDLPELTDTEYPPGTFWEGKLGAAVPRGKQPGWLIPDELRGRWRLSLGRSQELLPPLLARLGEIDFFLHDSEHSEECMSFEYRAAWERLRPGGVLVSDDVGWNDAFATFAGQRSRPIHALSATLALLIK